MRRLSVFNQVSLDGFIADSRGDMSWAHKHDPEWSQFVTGNAEQKYEMLFGRVTYQMMAAFWPTPAAAEAAPELAERMNSQRKLVFSHTLKEAVWQNSTLLKTPLSDTVREMKQAPGPDLIIFGSGTLVAQLAEDRLVDEFQLVINPLLLGQGKSMFDRLKGRLDLKLIKSRAFQNGNVLVTYAPAE